MILYNADNNIFLGNAYEYAGGPTGIRLNGDNDLNQFLGNTSSGGERVRERRKFPAI